MNQTSIQQDIPIRRSSESADFRRNNFNLVRFIAAFLVMAGHMAPILGAPDLVLGAFGLHTYGVQMLFLIGGYLVASSWRRDPNPFRFAVRRILRLWPPFAVMTLLMAFVAGPLLSELGTAGYFSSWWKAYLDNLRFFIVYAQPGVFTTTPIPNVTNGSLWTMPVEAALYVLTPLILILPGIRGRKSWAFPICAVLVTALICLGAWLDSHSDITWIVYATEWSAGLRLGIFFFIGMFCTLDPVRKIFDLQWAPVALLAILVVQYESRMVQYLVAELALTYLTFSLAFAPNPRFHSFGRKYDLAYGIYLYGFFFQQLTVYAQQRLGLNLGVVGSLAASMALTLPAAWISCALIERPCQKLTKWITGKMRRGQHQKRSRV